MARFQYNGEGERTFPSIAVTVQSGDSFDAPDDFEANGVSLSSSKKATPAVDTTPTPAQENK